jgi:hypothetical protein
MQFIALNAHFGGIRSGRDASETLSIEAQTLKRPTWRCIKKDIDRAAARGAVQLGRRRRSFGRFAGSAGGSPSAICCATYKQPGGICVSIQIKIAQTKGGLSWPSSDEDA